MIVQCYKCQLMIDPESCWITDGGAMCTDCCRKEYPARFASSTGEWNTRPGTDIHYHTWVKYVGLREVYEYCECGDKRRT